MVFEVWTSLRILKFSNEGGRGQARRRCQSMTSHEMINMDTGAWGDPSSRRASSPDGYWSGSRCRGGKRERAAATVISQSSFAAGVPKIGACLVSTSIHQYAFETLMETVRPQLPELGLPSNFLLILPLPLGSFTDSNEEAKVTLFPATKGEGGREVRSWTSAWIFSRAAYFLR